MDEVAFGRYRLLSLIGEGGMGKVYKAHDTVIDRHVAIKILPTELGAEPGYRDRFRREARIAARLNEPHIIPVHDTGEIEQQLYLVMPVIDGIDVQALLKRDGPMSPERAVHVVEQLAAALSAAHAAGLAHRDVKPSNALLTGRDFAYLIDFGIAQDATADKLTRTGMFVGSWPYMAPERFGSGRGDASADIYALACVLHECLTGAQPFAGDSLEQQFVGHTYGAQPRPSMLNPGVPAGFDDVIATGMAKDPGQRYSNALDLAVAAQQALGTSPVSDRRGTHTVVDSPQPVPGAGRRRSRDARTRPAAPARPPRRAADHGARPASINPTPAAIPNDSAPAQFDNVPSPPRKVRPLVVTVAVLSVVLVAVAAGYVLRPNTRESSDPTAQAVPVGGVTVQPEQPSGTAPQSAPPEGDALPFTDLNNPAGVAVDTDGDVFVADTGNNRVLELAAGSGGPMVLPLTGLGNPSGVAVDASGGTIYIANSGNNRLLRQTAGASSTTELPVTGLNGLRAVAVDAADNLYIAAGNQVLKLAAGSTTTTVLPLPGLGDPSGVAVGGDGAVYVTDATHGRVLKVTAGADTSTVLPFTDLSSPSGVAVDNAGNVYVADSGNGRVMKLEVAAGTPTALSVTGLDRPVGVAVDDQGNVYLSDGGNNRVLKVSAR